MYTDELTDLFVKGLKTALPAIAEDYGRNEDVYIISFENDNLSGPDGEFDLTLYVNTEEHHQMNLKEAADDPWYYRFCEYEWYIIPEPEAFDEAAEFINNGYATFDRETVYECFVKAVEQLRAEKFIENTFAHDIFITVNGSEVFGEEEMVDLAVRMNGRENCKDYIAHTEDFL